MPTFCLALQNLHKLELVSSDLVNEDMYGSSRKRKLSPVPMTKSNSSYSLRGQNSNLILTQAPKDDQESENNEEIQIDDVQFRKYLNQKTSF